MSVETSRTRSRWAGPSRRVDGGVVSAAGIPGEDGRGGGPDPGGHEEKEKSSTKRKTTKTTAKPKSNNINITGMGSRYIDGEVSGTAIAVNALLALASLVAVAYLIFTAPNKDSLQFARTGDGPEFAKLGLVEEVQEGLV